MPFVSDIGQKINLVFVTLLVLLVFECLLNEDSFLLHRLFVDGFYLLVELGVDSGIQTDKILALIDFTETTFPYLLLIEYMIDLDPTCNTA